MTGPTLETKKKFIAWFIRNHPLQRREALWILNYLLNHELLLKQMRFVEGVKYSPRGLFFSTEAPLEDSFIFYKNGHAFRNPEQAFHDMRLNWKEACYLEFQFPQSYQALVSFGVLEKNPYAPEPPLTLDPQLDQAMASLQKSAQCLDLEEKINQALEVGDKETFMALTQQLLQLKEGGPSQ